MCRYLDKNSKTFRAIIFENWYTYLLVLFMYLSFIDTNYLLLSRWLVAVVVIVSIFIFSFFFSILVFSILVFSKESSDYTLWDLDWYTSWLAHQFSRVPAGFLHVRYDENSSGVFSDSTDFDFLKVFATVNKYVCQGESCGIDEIVEHLVTHYLRVSQKYDSDTVLHQRYLVFPLLGWQSVLFLPSFDFYPLSEYAIHRVNAFVVHQDVNQPFRDLSMTNFTCLWIWLIERWRSCLEAWVINLLPSRPADLAKLASEISKEASVRAPIVPAEVNEHVLSKIFRVRTLRVDTLSLHLDYDQATRTLSLLHFQSLCVATLRSRGALYSFASSERALSRPWSQLWGDYWSSESGLAILSAPLWTVTSISGAFSAPS